MNGPKNDHPPLRIARLAADDGTEAIHAARLLLGEYRDYALSAAGPGFKMATFEAEIAGLPASHVVAGGGLLIAWTGAEPAGCVALRPLPEVLPEQATEIKRLWVRERHRGRGIAERLVETAMAETRAAGGSAVYLDTEPERMPGAVRLYRRLGFAPCPLYRPSGDGVEAFKRALG